MVDEAAPAAPVLRRTPLVTTFECNSQIAPLRKAKGLDRESLAGAIGASEAYVERLECGLSDPSTRVIARLARALDTDEFTIYRAIRHQRLSIGADD